MSQPDERVSSRRRRHGSILRRLTAGVALSAAAVTAALAGVPAALADRLAKPTDDNRSSAHLGQLVVGGWGVVAVPEYFGGTTAHTVSEGS